MVLKMMLLVLVAAFALGCNFDELEYYKDGATDEQFRVDLEDCFDQVYSFGKYEDVPCPWPGKDGLMQCDRCMGHKGWTSRWVLGGKEFDKYKERVWKGKQR